MFMKENVAAKQTENKKIRSSVIKARSVPSLALFSSERPLWFEQGCDQCNVVKLIIHSPVEQSWHSQTRLKTLLCSSAAAPSS